jgi:hypothetical protein
MLDHRLDILGGDRMAGKILGRCIVAMALALVGQGVIACGEDGDDGPDCSANTLTYVNFGEPLIRQNCLSCHGATPLNNMLSLTTQAAVKAESHEIIEHAVELEEPAMPFGLPPLPLEQRNNLKLWLECGAP